MADGKRHLLAARGGVRRGAALQVIAAVDQQGNAVLRANRQVGHLKRGSVQGLTHIVDDRFGDVDRKANRLGRAGQIAEGHCGLPVGHGDLVAGRDFLQGLRGDDRRSGDQAGADQRRVQETMDLHGFPFGRIDGPGAAGNGGRAGTGMLTRGASGTTADRWCAPAPPMPCEKSMPAAIAADAGGRGMTGRTRAVR